ncbi:MAG: 16S rRNA (cytosine(1402)-N(4))-methyltransferase, partial [Rhodoferax sp.]|nr:16S rRNA (cytosine(1402)-N(4))-methyltransferase [Rhodoferax sp.]
MDNTWTHTTVLLKEAVAALLNNPDDEPGDLSAGMHTYVDATFGRGGHARLILSKLAPQGRLIAFDKDLDALAEAATIDDPRFSIRHQGFRHLGELAP